MLAYVITYIHTYKLYIYMVLTSNSYNTPRRAVSDLQSPIPRVRSARGGGDCKSDTARLGVL